jgi:hypothetical protein
VADNPRKGYTMNTEFVMKKDAAEESMQRAWTWVRQHPFAVTTAAVVLIAALALPFARQAAPPAADVGPDETPLFV